MSTEGRETTSLRATAESALRGYGSIAFAVFWALFALAASLSTHVFPGGDLAFHLDLRVFRAGAQAFLDGVPLYQGPLDIGGGYEMPFTYPPIAAVLFIPLTWVDVAVAGAIWTALTYGALALSLVIAARWTGRSHRASLLIGFVGMCFATALTPVWMTLNLGQIGIFLMLLVLADLLSAPGRRPRGILVGVAAAIKLTPAGFILLPLLRRDWRTAVWMVAAAVTLTVVGAVLAWNDSVEYWSTLGAAGGRVTVFDETPNMSIAGLTSHIASGVPGMAILLVCDAAAIALAIVAMRRQLAIGDTASALMVNAVLLLLVSPVSWDHHWVWAAPIILFLGLASVRQPSRIGLVFVATAAVFTIDDPFPGSWGRWVLWGVMYCVLLIGIQPDPRLRDPLEPARVRSRRPAPDQRPPEPDPASSA